MGWCELSWSWAGSLGGSVGQTMGCAASSRAQHRSQQAAAPATPTLLPPGQQLRHSRAAAPQGRAGPARTLEQVEPRLLNVLPFNVLARQRAACAIQPAGASCSTVGGAAHYRRTPGDGLGCGCKGQGCACQPPQLCDHMPTASNAAGRRMPTPRAGAAARSWRAAPLTCQRAVGEEAHVALAGRAHLGQVRLKGAPNKERVAILDGNNARQPQLLRGLQGNGRVVAERGGDWGMWAGSNPGSTTVCGAQASVCRHLVFGKTATCSGCHAPAHAHLHEPHHSIRRFVGHANIADLQGRWARQP